MDLGIVDPHMLMRKALCALLADVQGVRVVLDVDRALDNVQLLQQLQPDILLIHASDPPTILTTILQIKKLLAGTKLILLTDEAEVEFELRAVRAGALGCVSKRSEPRVLLEALRTVEKGEAWISQRAATRIIGEFARGETSGERNGPEELTRREREILALMAKGYRNKEIANQLVVSENTIKTHLLTIYRKLGVSGRMAAALHYFQGTSLRDRISQS